MCILTRRAFAVPGLFVRDVGTVSGWLFLFLFLSLPDLTSGDVFFCPVSNPYTDVLSYDTYLTFFVFTFPKSDEVHSASGSHWRIPLSVAPSTTLASERHDEV